MKTYKYIYNLKPKKRKWISFLYITIIILLGALLNVKVCDSYKTYGVYDGYSLLVSVPIGNSDIIKNGIYAKVNNDVVNYSIDTISNLKVENLVNYESIKINIDRDYRKNEVIEITFYNNEEKIIKKIIKLIF